MGQSSSRKSVVASVDALSVLRHEMANVINGLAGMAQLLRSSQLSPEQLHWLDAIGESTKQARFLLRYSSRGGPGPTGPGRHETRLNGVRLLEQFVMAHTPAVLKAERRLLLELEPGLGDYWRVDAGLLRQLLDNLLANALKFAPEGDVLVSAMQRGGAVVIRVDDCGPGVAAADRDLIFEPGQRGGVREDIPGQGLGLALCRELAGCLRGHLHCLDAPGGGARFELVLQACRPREATRPRLAAFANVQCVLDLDPVLERIVKKMLERLGVPFGRNVYCGAKDDGLLEITIRNGGDEGLRGLAVLALQSVGTGPGRKPVSLPPPLLESSLQRALLRQVLDWRWSVSGRSGARG